MTERQTNHETRESLRQLLKSYGNARAARDSALCQYLEGIFDLQLGQLPVIDADSTRMPDPIALLTGDPAHTSEAEFCTVGDAVISLDPGVPFRLYSETQMLEYGAAMAATRPHAPAGDAELLQVAARHGNRYVNRHYKGQESWGFLLPGLLALLREISGAPLTGMDGRHG